MSGTFRENLKRCGKILLLGFLCLFLFAGIFVLNLVVHHNLSASALTGAIKEHGIKSIINLRGGTDANDWHRAETATARQLGVQHFDFNQSANREFTESEMEQILTTIDAAPKPVLIHCKSGSDRTGLVGALYLYSLEGKSVEIARHQLTALYGHVPHLFWRDTFAMDISFQKFIDHHARQPGLGGLKSNDSSSKEIPPADLVHARPN
jgi:protein tyrosine phosphatase (PTP) superfamily phosphohydrolase (DUF442 family)